MRVLSQPDVFCSLDSMEVNLNSDQQAFVRQAIASGRLHREEEAVEEALALWEERERRRIEFLASLDEAEASLDRGEGIEITPESIRALAEDKKSGAANVSLRNYLRIADAISNHSGSQVGYRPDLVFHLCPKRQPRSSRPIDRYCL